MTVDAYDNRQKYRMIFDYHTHTVFSHGKGTIEENVKMAAERGLKGIAISDHGPGHLTYGLKRSRLPEMRAEIERLRMEYPKMSIYLSVEANVVSQSANKEGNCIDICPSELVDYDFILAGYHYGVFGGYTSRNWLCEHDMLTTGRRRRDLLVKNTDMAVRAIHENNIRIFTHPGDKGPFDIFEIAKACSATGTWMEISAWHKNLTTEEIRIAAKTDATFVVSSDAHRPEAVGTYGGAVKRALEADLDIERIVNIEKIK